jgi:hypothetical protein
MPQQRNTKNRTHFRLQKQHCSGRVDMCTHVTTAELCFFAFFLQMARKADTHGGGRGGGGGLRTELAAGEGTRALHLSILLRFRSWFVIVKFKQFRQNGPLSSKKVARIPCCFVCVDTHSRRLPFCSQRKFPPARYSFTNAARSQSTQPPASCRSPRCSERHHRFNQQQSVVLARRHLRQPVVLRPLLYPSGVALRWLLQNLRRARRL